MWQLKKENGRIVGDNETVGARGACADVQCVCVYVCACMCGVCG